MELSTASLVSQNNISLPSTAIPVSQMLRPQITGGKVAVSVDDFSIYTNFKHITVMPAGDNGGAHSSSRLRMLDALIDRLVKIKERSVDRSEAANLGGMSEEALDALIDEYAQKYKNLSARSSEQLNSRVGANFGIQQGEEPLFLDLIA